jgi:hypothetical protein
VLDPNTLLPIPTFPTPVVLLDNTNAPIATLSVATVLAANVFKPIAIFPEGLINIITHYLIKC